MLGIHVFLDQSINLHCPQSPFAFSIIPNADDVSPRDSADFRVPSNWVVKGTRAAVVMIMNLATLVDRSRMREATARLSTEVRRAREAVPKRYAKYCTNRRVG